MTSDLQGQLQEVLGIAYRIDRELSGAGMSRVFVATESELNRQVVVKVLPPDLAAGINVDRFRREIQLAARLQHPHIVPLLAAGASGSLLYYTMPFITGETLRARLSRTGELPVQEATKILREVADALSYAHSEGAVHRDIKPENIMLSGSHALVVDFGVSKALSSATSEIPAGDSLTSLGVALGTPAYMAPEQAAADPKVDARADIYALGVVAYEILSGRTPFSGLNQQQTLAAHITTQPAPVTLHRPQLPEGLALLVMRCLEKHPSDRWQSAEDLHSALEPYAMTSGATAPSLATSRKPFRWTPQRVAIAAGVVGLIATGLIVSTVAFRQDSGERFSVSSTRQVTNDEGLEILPSISPDGRLVAYTVARGQKTSLHVRQISGGRPILLAEDGAFASWIADASQILFTSSEFRSYLVPALGGVPRLIPNLDGLDSCAMSHRGDRVACRDAKKGILVIASIEGTSRRSVDGTAVGDGVTMPAWSDDDKLIAYTLGNPEFSIGVLVGNLAPSSVWVVSADGDKPTMISDNTHLNVSPAWTPGGDVLYVSSIGGNRDIYLQRLTGDLSPRGDPVRLTTGLSAHTISVDRLGKTVAYGVFSTTSNIYSTPIPSTTVTNPPLRQVTTGNQTVEAGAVSPDGKWLAYDSNINGNQDIFKMLLPNGEPQQLTHNGVDNFNPSWSPDGRQIVFHSLVRGNRDIYLMDATGANLAPVMETPAEEMGPTFTSNGQSIFYARLPDSAYRINRDPKSASGWSKPIPVGAMLFGTGSPTGVQAAVQVGNNKICTPCPAGLYMTDTSFTDYKPISTSPTLGKIAEDIAGIFWSTDGRRLYFAAATADGVSSIWQLAVNGNPERLLVRLTDPATQFYRPYMVAGREDFYFPIGRRSSDIWTLELKKEQ